MLDMDGLMLDTEPLFKGAWQTAACELGYPLDDAFYLQLVGRTNDAGEDMLAARFGPGFPIPCFRERWNELWCQEVEAHSIPLKRGLPELLESVAGRLPVAVATSSDRQYAKFSLARAGLNTRCFAHVVTGDQVERGKPAPDIYLEAARRLGVPPQYCLAVEDSDAGVLSAHAAGMIVVIVPDLKPPSRQARTAAFRVVGSLHEVISLCGLD